MNAIFLYIEKNNNTSLLLVLILFITIFFGFRVISFYYTGFSRALYLSGGISAQQYNYAFAYIICSVLMLSLGLIISSISFDRIKNYVRPQIKYINHSIKILLLIFLLSIMVQTFYMLIPKYLGNNALSYYLRIFPVRIVIFYAILYLLLCKYFNPPLFLKNKIMIQLFLLFGILLITIIGSRRIILDIVLFFTFITLAIDQKRVKFNVKHVVIILFIIIPISLIFYDLATFLRWARYNEIVINQSSINYGEIMLSYLEKGIFKTANFKSQLDRIGYIDMAIETITYSHNYNPILNIIHYFKSVVDSLSPGFEIFNTPLSGQAKQFIFTYGYIPSNSDLFTVKYNSNAFSIFGEFYTLFGGFWSFIIFLFFGFIFERFYKIAEKFPNLFDKIFFKSITIFFFFEFFLFSFGLDWLLVNTVHMLVSFLLLRVLLKNKIKSININQSFC
jgi:hypothetical protein